MLLISTSTFLPVTTSEINETNSCTREMITAYPKQAKNQSDKEGILEIYEKMVDKISKQKDPSLELSYLFLQPEIKDIITTISDQYTVETISILFSNNNILSKINYLAHYQRREEQRRKNETVQQLEQILGKIIETNLSYFETDTILPNSFQNEENRTLLYSSWIHYLHNNPKIKETMNNLFIDPVIFFVTFSIAMALWGFGLGAMSCCIPELIPLATMITEAVILGLLSGQLINFFFQSNSTFFNTIMESICTIFLITPDQLNTACACLSCLIVLAAYLYIWEICPISALSTLVKTIGGGTMVVAPPFLFSWFIASNIRFDDESGVSN